MKENLKVIETRINQIQKEKESCKLSIDTINNTLKQVNEYIENPNSINVEQLGLIVPENRKNNEYQLLIKMVGSFNKGFDSEPQIIVAKSYLNTLVDELVEKYDKERQQYIDKNQELDKKEQEEKKIYEIINNYTNETYITEDILNIIYDYFKEEPNQELIKFFITIARNNALIELKQHLETTDKPVTDEQDEQMDIDTTHYDIPINKDELFRELYEQDEVDEIEQFKINLKNGYREFIENHSYLNDKIYNNIMLVLKDIDEQIDNFSVNELASVKEAVVNDETPAEYIALYEDKNEMLLAFLVSLIRAHSEKNEEEFKNIIDMYKQSNNADIDNLIIINEYEHLKDTLERAKIIAQKFYNRDERTINNLKSFSNIKNKEMRKENLKQVNLTENDLLCYMCEIPVEDILREVCELIRKQPKERAYIDERASKLKDYVEKYESISNIQIEKNEPTEEKTTDVDTSKEPTPTELYEDNFEHYLIFLDGDNFLKQTKFLQRNYPKIISKTNFISGLDILNHSSMNSLNESGNAKIINLDHGVINPYGIRRVKAGNAARIGYKLMDGVKYKGHDIILVLVPCYGAIDGLPKTVELNKSVKLFKKELKKYETIEKSLSENATESQKAYIEELIKQSIEIYKEYQPTDEKGRGGI